MKTCIFKQKSIVSENTHKYEIGRMSLLTTKWKITNIASCSYDLCRYKKWVSPNAIDIKNCKRNPKS